MLARSKWEILNADTFSKTSQECLIARCRLRRLFFSYWSNKGFFFDYTHRKRSSTESSSSDGGSSLGGYVTSRDSRIASNYNANLTQKYGEDATFHPIIDEELWQQAVGGSKKGRTYGFSNKKRPATRRCVEETRSAGRSIRK